MPLPYLVDTNAYHLFFSNSSPEARTRLEELLLTSNGNVEFYISEITSLEIYSVLGKRRRGVQNQEQLCTRTSSNGLCTQSWITTGKRGIKDKVFRKLIKIVSDIQQDSGEIRAAILPLDSAVILEGKNFLINYADRFNFGSQDALIAGTVVAYKNLHGTDLTVITSDRGLKAALSSAKIPIFDPLVGDSTTP
jgi:predicted nucleic acid-binding protein